MSRKRQVVRAQPAEHKRLSPDPILVLPTQTASAIAERLRIREESNDARAVTIKVRRPK